MADKAFLDAFSICKWKSFNCQAEAEAEAEAESVGRMLEKGSPGLPWCRTGNVIDKLEKLRQKNNKQK